MSIGNSIVSPDPFAVSGLCVGPAFEQAAVVAGDAVDVTAVEAVVVVTALYKMAPLALGLLAFGLVVRNHESLS